MNGRLHSCVNVIAVPPARYIIIRLDPREQVLSVVRALGHELQHAVEISTTPDAVDERSIERLYARLGYENCGREPAACWETRQAQDVESRVVTEVQHARPTTARISPGYFGSWALDVGESMSDGSPELVSGCLFNRDQGFGLISTSLDTMDASGAAHHWAYVYRLDGREYQMSQPNERPRRTIAITPVDEFNAEVVLRSDGAIVATGRWILAMNGQTLVVQMLHVDADGNEAPTVTMWHRQPAR